MKAYRVYLWLLGLLYFLSAPATAQVGGICGVAPLPACQVTGGGGGLTANVTIINGANQAAVKPASTAPVATDPALVVGLSPNSAVPTGAATSTLQTSVGATAHTDAATINTTLGSPMQTTGGTVGLVAGSALVGKFGIDQTTPGTTNGVQTLSGSVTSLSAATHVQTSALAANQIIVASAHNLTSFEVSADSTLSGAAWWIMIYDATSAPADGAVTPAKCYALPSGATSFNGAFNSAPAFTTGIVIGVSTTGCFTKTASAHAFISGDYQ